MELLSLWCYELALHWALSSEGVETGIWYFLVEIISAWLWLYLFTIKRVRKRFL